jgi:glutamyl-tRNA reductase
MELRERVAFTDAEIPPALRQLTESHYPILEQAAILSTCNRAELYGVGRWRRSAEQLVSFFARYHGLEPQELVGAVYIHRGERVAHHLAATAAGLHSLVLGEAQIQGQVRSALTHALRTGTAGPELRRLFESAIAAGRRVRSETAIGRGVASIPQASVEFVRQRLGTLNRSTVLLIGAGATANLAARQLVKRGVGQLFVLGRDQARARRLAERYDAQVITRDRLLPTLAECDAVISSTSAPFPILHRDQLQPVLVDRMDSWPLLLIDLAMPHDVEPAVAGLAGAELHRIDDLQQVVELAFAQRRAELPAAYAILDRQVARFTDWLQRRQAAA